MTVPIEVSDSAPRSLTVLQASPRAFCAGVERAIEIVERLLKREDAPVYVRKQIVHNVHVVRGLEARGAVFVEELDEVPEGATIVFSAHGVSPEVRRDAERRGLRAVDATCPLVAKVHAEARRFAGRGDTIILVGHHGHEESEGTLGEAPEQTVLVETVEDVHRLSVSGPVSYLMQTTLAVDEAVAVVDALQARFSELRGPDSDDICYATTNRQNAVRAVAGDADVILVVGSRNSSNSVRLVEVARRAGARAYLIDDADDIDPEWIRDAKVIGLTAGASASPVLVSEVLESLRGYGDVKVLEREVTKESVHFVLPTEVRTR
jgi:4-hydroxy-3-methylbut-2-en-1-yl diphosphate reductase